MGRSARRRMPAVLSREEGLALAKRILELIGEPRGEVRLRSEASATTSVARGDAHLVTEGGSTAVLIALDGGTVRTTQLDEAGLEAAVAAAKAAAKAARGEVRGVLQPWSPDRGPEVHPTPPKLRFDSVTNLTAEVRAEVFRRALDATEAAGLVGAGDLTSEVYARLRVNTAGFVAHAEVSYTEFSLTARTKDGMGSGWAWSGYEDWSRVRPEAVIARAVDLAQRSAKPVAVEPGRYTVILEPAAVAALISGINWDAYLADLGRTVFSKKPLGTNKIGLQMIDARLGMVADPWDPEMPQSTLNSFWDVADKVVWFDQGVLKNLIYEPYYAKQKGREPVLAPDGFRLSATGRATTLEEMIASTKRGIWVNRLSGISSMNGRTCLLTGTTRDGTFLIENGKITKAIKNFRFTESPFFVLNKLEAWGEPVRAARTIVAPRLMVRDFDFTSLSDAV